MTLHPPWTPTDAVGEALHVLRMSGTFYCRSELSAPWGFTLPAMPGCLWFHVVTAGGCLLEVGDGVRELREGDLVLVPRGEGHALRSDPQASTPSILAIPHDMPDSRYAVLRHGGGGAPATMVCGAVRFDHPAARTLVGLLPDLIHVPVSPLTDRLRDTLRLIALEVEELRPGGEAVITRLADVLVIQAIRTWMETDAAARTGWLGALADPQIGRALALVHRDPARDWSVATLAAEGAMSRSAFAARFTALVGEPAMAYVTRWRMHVALDRLAGGDTVARIAADLGYRSEAAFSRAFTRVVGEPPGAARRALAARAAPAGWETAAG
ncbi:AraC family transcriptional regulator [Pseudonocardia halophobica]|uniref:AraC family transcriptional regulator n=1 Tax=Pseudonocardia halophobica TaxID=29401 RepID=UPI003D8DBB7A